MAEVTGPIRTLPGARHELPEGTKCDVHPDRDAVARIQGETDSMGAELNDCCQECVDEIKNTPPTVGTCEWCHTPNVELKNRRDFEEGLAGRVYEVCSECIKKDNKRIDDELALDYENYGYED